MSSVWSIFALLLFCPALGFDLQILHTNDLHSRFGEINENTRDCKADQKCFGGFARIAHYFKSHRKNNTLILNAGDSFQGTPLFVAFGSEIVEKMVNFLEMDAMSLGNHEFDRGPKVLKEYIDKVKTPVVTCNVDGSSDTDFAESKLKKSIVKTVGKVKVGIVGYVIKEVKEMSRVGNITITDEIECITQQAKKLKEDEKVNIVIAVGHSGWTKDLEIAKKVEQVDVVVGGHTDTFLYTGTPPSIEKVEGPYPTLVNQSSGKQVPAVQAFGYTKYVGELNLSFDDNTYKLTNASGNPVLITADMEKNENVTKVLEEFKEKLSKIYQQPVCQTLVDLNGSCKSKECNMGNIFTKATSEFVEKESNSTSDEFKMIGLVNGGNIRTSLSKSSLENNTITFGDLATVLPYPNYLMQVRMNGSLLMDFLNISYHKISLGGFLQMSQMKVTYFHNNKTAEAFVLKKTGEMEKVDCKKKYDVVVTDYLYTGDGYDFRKGELINTFNKPALNVVEEWMKNNAPINVTEMDTIVFYDDCSPFYPK
ncbi:protein 5NUC-like [Cimex lectularius]|uniref:5'-nucleotidase n=1 Tax=Cimex lectularius TaxID=79782 RepID=A0A8I6TDY3_CIMLE|nr:protein 5NUC-like [Cimex lectularius]